jgi:hypothetical protein
MPATLYSPHRRDAQNRRGRPDPLAGVKMVEIGEQNRHGPIDRPLQLFKNPSVELRPS